jgi:hypothetical protein
VQGIAGGLADGLADDIAGTAAPAVVALAYQGPDAGLGLAIVIAETLVQRQRCPPRYR